VLTPAAEHGYSRAAVIGAGLMGRRIAGVLARTGLDLVLYDERPEILEAARSEAAELAGHGVGAGGVGAGGVGAGRVEIAATLAEAVSGADLVVEAVIEDLTVKQELFARLAALAPGATLATNTSVLPVSSIAAKVPDARNVIGTHWWNPPDLIPIVEVVPTPHTAPRTRERITALLTAAGKTPVLVRRDGAGFIGNRLQHALWREAIALVEEGVADAETVDLVVRDTIGLRLAAMGPLENADYVGLDLTLAIHEAVLPLLSRQAAPNRVLAELVGHGELGAKTGGGFLPWPPGRRDQTAARLAAHVEGQLAARNARHTPI